MAAGIFGTEYTVTASAVSLSTILGSNVPNYSNIVILANPSNTGTIYLGASNVTTSANRRVVLLPGDSFAVGLAHAFGRLQDWYIVGPGTGEIAHIVGLV